MNRENLKNLGLNEEQTEGVMKLYGQDINPLNEKIKALEADKITLESSYKESSEQIKLKDEVIKKFEDLNVDGLNDEIAKYKKEVEELGENHAKELYKRDFDNLLNSLLIDSGVTDLDYIKYKLSSSGVMDKMALSDDKKSIIGFSDMIKDCKENNKRFFKDDSEKKNKPSFLNSSMGDSDTESASEIEQIKDIFKN